MEGVIPCPAFLPAYKGTGFPGGKIFMNILNQVLSALDNPDQDATSGQMAVMLNTVQQLGDTYGTDALTVRSMLLIVGNHIRSALQQKRTTEGTAQAEAVVDRYSGTYPNDQAVNVLFNSPQVEGIVQEIANRTGLNAATIQDMLPILVPLVLNFLKTGSKAQHSQGSNPVLNAFLDADGDRDIDIADAILLAGRHVGG